MLLAVIVRELLLEVAALELVENQLVRVERAQEQIEHFPRWKAPFREHLSALAFNQYETLVGF